MFLKLICISTLFIVTVFLYSILPLWYKGDPKKLEANELLSKNIVIQFVKFGDGEEKAVNQRDDESDFIIHYMERIEKNIALRRLDLLRKLSLLEQEDKAVKAAFKRALERLRDKKTKPPVTPIIRSIDADAAHFPNNSLARVSPMSPPPAMRASSL